MHIDCFTLTHTHTHLMYWAPSAGAMPSDQVGQQSLALHIVSPAAPSCWRKKKHTSLRCTKLFFIFIDIIVHRLENMACSCARRRSTYRRRECRSARRLRFAWTGAPRCSLAWSTWPSRMQRIACEAGVWRRRAVSPPQRPNEIRVDWANSRCQIRSNLYLRELKVFLFQNSTEN